jgi:ATP-binding cassette, subfamily B, bacterial
VAHRLSTIRLAQRVVLLEDGKILADGTHAELMETVPSYSEVLSRAEEEWAAAHAAQAAELDGGDGGEPSPGMRLGPLPADRRGPDNGGLGGFGNGVPGDGGMPPMGGV